MIKREGLYTLKRSGFDSDCNLASEIFGTLLNPPTFGINFELVLES